MAIVQDVQALLVRDLTAEENTAVDRLIDLALGALEGALPGFTVNAGTETVTIDPGNPDELWTPRYPVSAVNTVTVDGQAITDTVTWNQQGRIRARTSALNDFELNLAVLTTSTVTVDYDYGFDGTTLPLPDDVSGVAAGMVAAYLRRNAANPDGLASTTLGAYSESHFLSEVQAAAEGVTAPTGTLRRWRRNRQLSVPLYR